MNVLFSDPQNQQSLYWLKVDTKFAQSGAEHRLGLWKMCTFRPPKDGFDSKLVPYTGGCARINLLSEGGQVYVNLTRYDQLLELPFPGASFQTARIWLISALALDIFGGGIILGQFSN